MHYRTFAPAFLRGGQRRIRCPEAALCSAAVVLGVRPPPAPGIPCSLQTAINSQLPGFVTCLTQTEVRSLSGKGLRPMRVAVNVEDIGPLGVDRPENYAAAVRARPISRLNCRRSAPSQGDRLIVLLAIFGGGGHYFGRW